MITYYADGVTQKDGDFRFEEVPSGQYNVNPELADSSAYYYDGKDSIEVKSGETAQVSLELKPAVKLQGKVVDQQSGQGVAGVRVNLYFNDQRGPAGRQNTATTDAAGAFTIYTRPGKAQVNIWQIPEQYTNLSSSRQVQNVEIKEDTRHGTHPTGEGKRAGGDRGGQIGQSGRRRRNPLLLIGLIIPYLLRKKFAQRRGGKIRFEKYSAQRKDFDPGRTKKAAAEPVSFTAGESPLPIRLIVDEKTAFTMRGTVVDDAGQPIAQTEIVPTIHLWFGNWGTSYSSESCKTDAEGKFEIGGLWPGDKYDIHATAKGYEKYSTRQIEGTSGGVHDFGKIMLVGAGCRSKERWSIRRASPCPTPGCSIQATALNPWKPDRTTRENSNLKAFAKGRSMSLPKKKDTALPDCARTAMSPMLC